MILFVRRVQGSLRAVGRYALPHSHGKRLFEGRSGLDSGSSIKIEGVRDRLEISNEARKARSRIWG